MMLADFISEPSGVLFKEIYDSFTPYQELNLSAYKKYLDIGEHGGRTTTMHILHASAWLPIQWTFDYSGGIWIINLSGD